MRYLLCGVAALCLAAVEALLPPPATAGDLSASDLAKIETVVVLYAENRSFDNLYGHFPGANGLANLTSEMTLQRDRDGSVLKELPPIWGGLKGKGGVFAQGHPIESLPLRCRPRVDTPPSPLTRSCRLQVIEWGPGAGQVRARTRPGQQAASLLAGSAARPEVVRR